MNQRYSLNENTRVQLIGLVLEILSEMIILWKEDNINPSYHIVWIISLNMRNNSRCGYYWINTYFVRFSKIMMWDSTKSLYNTVCA